MDADIGSWNVSNVTNMYQMFHGAHAFNQNIGDWPVSNIRFYRDGMFDGCPIIGENMPKKWRN